MTIAAYIAAIILFPVSILHIAWAYGVLWPARTEEMLIKTVIGHPELTKMPGQLLTLMVAAAIAAAGFIALFIAYVLQIPYPIPPWCFTMLTVFLACVFALRGLSSYLIDGPLGQRVEPFATLDRRYFAPLCLLLCACFTVIFLVRLSLV